MCALTDKSSKQLPTTTAGPFEKASAREIHTIQSLPDKLTLQHESSGWPDVS